VLNVKEENVQIKNEQINFTKSNDLTIFFKQLTKCSTIFDSSFN